MKREPGLIQLPDGRWKFRGYIDGTKGGRRLQHTFDRGTTRADAVTGCRDMLAKAAGHRGRPIPKRLTRVGTPKDRMNGGQGSWLTRQ